MKSTSLTRRELYDLIWSKPLRDVAADLGISDVGLAKVCERHRVPRPEQGYWNKINVGKTAKKSIFVEVDDVRLNRVEINGALSQLPPEVRSHLETSRAQRRAQVEAVARPLLAKAAISPPSTLHPAIVATAATLRKATADQFGTIRSSGVGLLKVEVSANSVERVVGFLDRLARSLEGTGLTFKGIENGIVVERSADRASFGIKEKTRRQKHEPTATELDAEAKRERQKERYWSDPRRYAAPDSLFQRAYPEYDTIQTGALLFEIEGYDSGLRHSWADGKVQSLESMLDGIADGIDAILTFRRVERERREERERTWNELCRRRELVQRRRERERQRLRHLRQIIRTQKEVELLKGWLDRASNGKDPMTYPQVQRMIQWVDARLAMLEENVSVHSIDKSLDRLNLFPTEDDLVDPLGEPPAEPQYSWQL